MDEKSERLYEYRLTWGEDSEYSLSGVIPRRLLDKYFPSLKEIQDEDLHGYKAYQNVELCLVVKPYEPTKGLFEMPAPDIRTEAGRLPLVGPEPDDPYDTGIDDWYTDPWWDEDVDE